MTSLRLISGLVAAVCITNAAVAQEAKPAGAKTPNAQTAGVDSSDASLRQALQDVLKTIKAMDEEAAKKNRLDLPSFEWMQLQEPKADALRAIGTALAKVGDRDAARKTWQSAIDVASTIEELQGKVDLFYEIAAAQIEVGDRDEALETLLQAMQAARLIKENGGPAGLRVFTNTDPAVEKAMALGTLASGRAVAGDRAGARKTFDQAIEAAEAIQSPVKRVTALMEIAENQPDAQARDTREKAIQFALALGDDYEKGRAVDAILRMYARIGNSGEIFRIVNNQLKGDIKRFGVWVAADALTGNDRTLSSKVVEQLLAAVEKADFNGMSKKARVLTRIAEGQAKLGDDEGAYRTLGAIEPDNAVLRFSYEQAKVRLMRDVAQAQIKAGQRDAARNTLQVALEIIVPFRGDGGTSNFPLLDIAVLQAKAGDLRGANETVEFIEGSEETIKALAAIATVQAEAGDRASARKTLARAAELLKNIPNETLWAMSSVKIPFVEDLTKRVKGRSERRIAAQMAWPFELLPSSTALTTIAVAEAKAGDVAGALKRVSAVAADKNSLSQTESAQAVAEIVKVQLSAKDFAGALKSAALLPDEDSPFGSEQNLLQDIAKDQAKAGDARGVLAWAVKQKSPKLRLALLQQMAEGIIARKTPEQKAHASATP